MKPSILALLSLLLLSCVKDENFTDDNLVGTWRLVAKVEISSGIRKNYPGTQDSFIQLKFSKDSIFLYGCNSMLGSDEYLLSEDNKITVEGFAPIEHCSTETVAEAIIHSSLYGIYHDTLKLTPLQNGQFILKFKKE